MILLTLAGSTLVQGVAGSVPDARARLEYTAGHAMDGRIDGGCVGHAVLVEGSRLARLEFASAGGFFERYTTELTTAAILPQQEDAARFLIDADQTRIDREVPGGTGRVLLEPTARVRIFGEHWPLPAPPVEVVPFQVRMVGNASTAQPLTNDLRTGDVYVERDGVVWNHLTSVPGWVRLVHLRGGAVEIRGNLTLYVDSALVEVGSDFREDLPPHRETVATYENGAAAFYRFRFHHGLVRLNDARILIDPSDAPFACSALQAELEGTLTAFAARGRISAGSRTVEFERREASLSGRFSVLEAPVTDGGEGSPAVVAEASGSFDAVGLDFADAGLFTPRTPPEVAAWTLAALVAAALGYAAKMGWPLYTRLVRHRLLDSETRSLIVEALRATPWMAIRQLQDATGLARSTLRYQLGVLRRHGLVRRLAAAGLERFAPADLAVAPPEADLRRILRASPATGTRRLAEVMRLLRAEADYSRFGAWKAVRRAARDGELALERRGREVWVRWPARP